MDLNDVIHELESGTASPQRRRYLRELLASADAESKPAGSDVDLQRCTTAHSGPVKVHGRQEAARCS